MMTVHVLHAGDGYTYLTRQVAAGDHTVRRGESLTDYYTVEGNPPGEWIGAGMTALGVSGIVAEEQMRALFGEGLHPDAEAQIAAAVAAGNSPDDAVQATRLGRRFPRLSEANDGWDDAIREAYDEFKMEHGRAPEVGAERDLIRWNVAAARVEKRLDRPGSDAEVSAHLAQVGKQARQPVAGYDLVFTPVKSVSVLWALGDRETSAQVHTAHTAAWQSTVAWLEEQAGVTRVGAGGVAQIDTHGFVAAAFEHRDSRTGDPNLHTHVAVSTKVLGVDGKWRSLDGRVLHALGVAASERYNTLVEEEVRRRLGVRFVDESRGRNKRSVREIAGISRELRNAFSSRRASIEDAYDELVAEYVRSHGHTPPRSTQLRLAQRATLATREGKAAPKSLEAQRAEWRATASQIIGEEGVDGLLASALATEGISAADLKLAEASTADLASEVLRVVEESRATWRRSHIVAEAQRLARRVANARPGIDTQQLVTEVTQAAVDASLSISAPERNAVPAELQRADGESIYRVHGTDRYSSARILDIENRLLQAAGHEAGFRVDEATLARTVDQLNATSKHSLNESQVDLARRFAAGGHRIEVGIGPAGTGKTTAMRAFARAVESGGGRVLALAPTAAASTVLAEEIDVEAETAHKLIDIHRNGSEAQRASEQYRIDERTVLLIDEAGMASTPLLDDVLRLAEQYGAGIRLLGDPSQLAAVESGGALRLLEQRTGAGYLDTVHRFVSKDEADASLQLRRGEHTALEFYVSHDRTRGGLRGSMLEEIYEAWDTDRAAGLHSIMVAGTNDEVAALNARARADLIERGVVHTGGVQLHDGNTAGVGDLVVTRQNERRLRANQGRDFVANGDLWIVLEQNSNGLKVKSERHGGVLTLPREYVAEHVELGYAATINRVQGMTVDTSHILVDPQSTAREQLYVAATRGRESNRMYVVVDQVLEVNAHSPDADRRSILDGLTSVLAREGAELSAHESIEHELAHAASLATLVPAYEDALMRVHDPARLERMAAAVRDALPEASAEAVIHDEAWTHLAARLADHEAHGADPAEVLRGIVQQGDEAGEQIDSLAKVYHHRIGPALEASADDDLPPWIAPPPADRDSVAEWLRAQADLIRERTRDLGDTAIADRAQWLRTLRPEPEDADDRTRWVRDVRTIAAYLDQRHEPGSPLDVHASNDDAVAIAAAAAIARQRRTDEETVSAADRIRVRLQGETNAPADQQPESAADRIRNINTDGATSAQRGDDTEPPTTRPSGPRQRL